MDAEAPAAFEALVERRTAARAGRLHHRPQGLLDDRARGRPRRADSPPRQREPDRGGGRAFRRARARSESSISAPARAPCCSPRSINGPRRAGSASMPRRRRSPRPAATRSRAPNSGCGDWGEGLDERFDLILCNPPYVEAEATTRAGCRRVGAGRRALCRRGRARSLSRARAAGRAACWRPAASPASKWAPDRPRRSARSSRHEGFTTESRNDLNGVERCLDRYGLIRIIAFLLGFGGVAA